MPVLPDVASTIVVRPGSIRPSASLVYIQATFRSGSSMTLSVIVCVQNDCGVNHGSITSTPPGARW